MNIQAVIIHTAEAIRLANNGGEIGVSICKKNGPSPGCLSYMNDRFIPHIIFSAVSGEMLV